MFKYHKHNNKTGTKAHLHKSLINFSPFDMRDTSYLEHLHKELKLRNAREGMVALRKDMIQANARSKYQNELDRLRGEVQRDNLPHNTKEHSIKQPKGLFFCINILTCLPNILIYGNYGIGNDKFLFKI